MTSYLDLARGDSSGISFKIPEQLHKAAFSTADWNRMKRDALMAAGWRFITKYLPLRFTDYARRFLGYRAKVDTGTIRWMSARGSLQHNPLVDSGTFRERLLAGAFPQAAAGGKALFIRTPFAHPLRPEHAAVLQRVTPGEMADMNKAAQEQLAADLMDAGVRSKSATKLALSPPQRASIALGLKDRSGGRYHLTAKRGTRAA